MLNRHSVRLSFQLLAGGLCLGAACLGAVSAPEKTMERSYRNHLVPLLNPTPLLADHPEYLEPIREAQRFEAPMLVDDPGADLSVRSWRFCYNARGIIEVPNRLRAAQTAVVVVHPWGIDDGQGWKSPEPAGVAYACTPLKNKICIEHAGRVINPFLKRMRGKVGAVLYTLPGTADPIRGKAYRTVHGKPTAEERLKAVGDLAVRLRGFRYGGESVERTVQFAADRPVLSEYFRQVPGLDAGARYDGEGFWNLPIPVVKQIEVAPDDVVIFDGEGYPVMRDFLKAQGIKNVLLAGYHLDMCVKSTCGGYQNLSHDFNVFVVGDATLATFPSNETPRFATNAALSFAALDQMITQVSWVRD